MLSSCDAQYPVALPADSSHFHPMGEVTLSTAPSDPTKDESPFPPKKSRGEEVAVSGWGLTGRDAITAVPKGSRYWSGAPPAPQIEVLLRLFGRTY